MLIILIQERLDLSAFVLVNVMGLSPYAQDLIRCAFYQHISTYITTYTYIYIYIYMTTSTATTLTLPRMYNILFSYTSSLAATYTTDLSLLSSSFHLLRSFALHIHLL